MIDNKLFGWEFGYNEMCFSQDLHDVTDASSSRERFILTCFLVQRASRLLNKSIMSASFLYIEPYAQQLNLTLIDGNFHICSLPSILLRTHLFSFEEYFAEKMK